VAIAYHNNGGTKVVVEESDSDVQVVGTHRRFEFVTLDKLPGSLREITKFVHVSSTKSFSRRMFF